MKQFARSHNLALAHVDTTQRGRGSMVMICTLCVTAFPEKTLFLNLHCIRIGGLSAQFWEKNLRAVHSLPLFAKADSDHHVCLDGVAISTVVVAGARGGRI